MTGPSALMGQAPLSHDDYLIRRALVIVAPSQLNPNKSEPFGPPRPDGYEFETHAPSLRLGEGVAIFFMILFTAARLYVRKFRSKRFGIDDWIIIPGALGALVYMCLDVVSDTKGCLGKHLYDCTYKEVYWYMRIAQVQQPLFYFTVFTIKLSIAFANRRITGLISSRWTIVHWTFISLFLILLPVCSCLQAFQCLPVPARYSLIYIGSMANPRELKCLDATAISLSTRILHAVTDLALLGVPITIILRSDIPRAKKVRITGIFALGGMSTLASIMRNVGITRDNLNDITWQYYSIYVWNTVDMAFGVSAASLPALNNLLDVGIDKVKSLSSRYGSNSSSRVTDDSHNLVSIEQPSLADSGVAVQKHLSTKGSSQTSVSKRDEEE
ncbi:hypothetical protein DM02DRAFT_653378 [Periconia macrospinosa]|uniref:Rhodopsin domain-containing protein n=1 Tax=Periconia macrospinosa TaxID=97972 RepID=A0A2V1DW29_9PLEO|nr:hypothetical protein DM02DRAFT_653378 [Periconia macrospinosa]